MHAQLSAPAEAPDTGALQGSESPRAGRNQTVVRNVLVLIVGQPITWSLSILYLFVVPRMVGAAGWGEITLAWGYAAAAVALADLGLATLVTREVGRAAGDSGDLLRAAIGVRSLLASASVLATAGLTWAVHFPAHEREVILLISIANLAMVVANPVAAALQGLQKMLYPAIGTFITSGLFALAATVLVRFYGFDVLGVAAVCAVAAIAGAAAQFAWLSRYLAVTPRLDPQLVRRLVRRGLPFWATSLAFTGYVWADSILLSIFTPTEVVGWYGVASRVITAVGFLPSAVALAVFPALSVAHLVDRRHMADLAARAIRFLVVLGLPSSVGLALVAPNLVRLLFGPGFDPAGPVLVTLSLTILPVFVATVVCTFLFAADRQLKWTYVMLGCGALNVALNLVAIPRFQAVQHNGAMGAAVALLVTDWAIGLAAVALLPRDVARMLAGQARPLVMSIVATGGMAAAVWFVRNDFVLLPLLVGAFAYLALALALHVYPREELAAVGDAVLRRVGRNRSAPSEPIPVEA